MKQVECNKCGKHFEVECEWGYCPFCESDNVEVFKNQLLNVQMVSSKEITKLHKELALTEKALELACEDIFENEFVYIEKHQNIILELVDYFKTKAKEILDET